MSAISPESEPRALSSARTEAVAAAMLARIIPVLLFRFALDLAYVFYVAPAFTADPITPMRLNLSAERYVLSIALVVIATMIVPFTKRNLSGISYMAAMMFLYVPMTSMIGFNTQLPIEPTLITLFAIVVSLVFVNTPLVPLLPLARNGERRAILLSAACITIFIGWSLYSGAAGNVTFDPDKMYDFRESNSTLLDVGAWSYIGLWAEKIFNPLLFAIALYHRNKVMILLSLAIQVYFFAITQHRIHLFAPVLVFMMYLLYSRRIELASIYLYSAIATVALLGIVLLFNFDEAASVLLRRSLYVAPSVTIDWISYFDGANKIFWTDRYLFGRPPTEWTGVDIPYFIGHEKFPDKPFAMSVGMVGAGYSQAGLWGVALYAAILGTIINFLNRLIRRGIPVYIAAAILIGPIRTAWADSDLLTTLLSHGIVVGILVLAVLGRLDRNQTQTR